MQDLLNEEDFLPKKEEYNFFEVYMSYYLLPVIITVFIIIGGSISKKYTIIPDLLFIPFTIFAVVSPVIMVAKKASKTLRKRELTCYFFILPVIYSLCMIIIYIMNSSLLGSSKAIAKAFLIVIIIRLFIYYIFITGIICTVKIIKER